MQTLIKSEIQARLVGVRHRARQPHGKLYTRCRVWQENLSANVLDIFYHPLTLGKLCEKGGTHRRRSLELKVLRWLFAKCTDSTVDVVMSIRKCVTLEFQISDISLDWGQTDYIYLKYPINKLKRVNVGIYNAFKAVQSRRKLRLSVH